MCNCEQSRKVASSKQRFNPLSFDNDVGPADQDPHCFPFWCLILDKKMGTAWVSVNLFVVCVCARAFARVCACM